MILNLPLSSVTSVNSTPSSPFLPDHTVVTHERREPTPVDPQSLAHGHQATSVLTHRPSVGPHNLLQQTLTCLLSTQSLLFACSQYFPLHESVLLRSSTPAPEASMLPLTLLLRGGRGIDNIRIYMRIYFQIVWTNNWLHYKKYNDREKYLSSKGRWSEDSKIFRIRG